MEQSEGGLGEGNKMAINVLPVLLVTDLGTK